MAKERKKRNKGNDNNEQPIEPVHLTGKEIDERLLEAGSEEELDSIHKVLRIEGVPDGSIRGAISHLKKKGRLIFQTAVTEYGRETKPLAVEAIIHEMKLPAFADGGREIFDSGVSYGMKALVAGVRLAQELSQMGIAQASPVIRMATEMRKAEGMSAQEAGQRAAEDALAGAIQYMSQQKPDIATVPNPMAGIVARAMEPALTKAMGSIFGVFSGQPPQGGGQGQGGQGQGEQPPVGSLPPGWSDNSKKRQDAEE